MKCLEKQYKKNTGRSARYTAMRGKPLTPDYITWLEKRVMKLTRLLEDCQR